MLIIEVKEGESIDRALRNYKRKHHRVGLIREIRKRQEFIKPSVERRKEVQKTLYRIKKYGDD